MRLFKELFNGSKKCYWSPEVFYVYLRQQVHLKENMGLNKKRILKYIPKKNDRFVIFGDVQGAFHSLVRGLKELKNLGILSEDLKIIPSNVYIVFNGDLINRSPYVMETMTVLFSLENANPDKVIYLCGNHEEGQEWRNYQLADEIIFKAPILSSDDVPTEELLNRYFVTLPLGIYVKLGLDFVRISHFRAHQRGLDAANFGHFLNKDDPEGAMLSLNLDEHTWDKENVVTKVSICGEAHTSYHQLTIGLELLFSDHGSTSWNVMSAPTEPFQKLFGFYNDSFLILTFRETVYESFFEHYSQDIRKCDGFQKRIFHPVYGVELENESQVNYLKEKEEIVIGCTLDLSKTSAVLGRRIREGLHAGILEANYNNALRDRFIRIVFLDDGYTPHIAKRNAQILLEDYKANIFLSSIGTPTTEAILPLVADKKIMMLFPFTGSKMFRKKELTNFIHYRPSLQKESYAITKFTANYLEQRKIAFFYQNDGYGLSCLEGAKKVLEDSIHFEYAEVPYERNTLNIDLAANIVPQFNPNAIIVFGTTAPALALIKKLGVEYLFDKLILGISFLTDVLRYFLRAKGLELIITRIVPNINSDIEIAQDYRKAISKYSPTKFISVDSFEAYIHSKLLEEFLRNIKGEVTHEAIIDQFESLKNYSFKGMNLDFNTETRELHTDVWVDLGKGPWMKLT